MESPAFGLVLPLRISGTVRRVDRGGHRDQERSGEIGCALYGGADGFPLEPSKATEQWHDAQSAGVQCRFADLDPGAYAVAVSHDFNGNRQTDTNFLGIPKEPWGVSNNARPRFRAPSFDEAAVQLDQDAGHRIEVRVAK